MVILTAIVFLAGMAFLLLTGAKDTHHLLDDLVGLYLASWGLYAMLSKHPRLELMRRFVLMTATFLLCVTVLEIPAFSGLLDFRRVFSIHSILPWEMPGYRYDSELIYVREPYYHLYGTYTRGNIGVDLCTPHTLREFDVTYDGNGFRNDVDLDHAEIVVIGDSYVESPMIAPSNLLTTVLGRLRHETVANLGASGYGPQQELVVLRRYGLPLQPHTVVWMFYEGNDLEDLDAYENQLATHSFDRNFVEQVWVRSFTRNILHLILRLNQTCPRGRDAKRWSGTLVDSSGAEHTVYFWDGPPPLGAADLGRLQKTADILETAYRLCRERGVELIVAFVPDAYRVYEGLHNMKLAKQNRRAIKPNDLPERFRSLIVDISDEIAYLDLTPVLRRATEKGILTYIHDDTHWTADGHRVVAMALHDLLTARRVTPIQPKF